MSKECLGLWPDGGPCGKTANKCRRARQDGELGCGERRCVDHCRCAVEGMAAAAIKSRRTHRVPKPSAPPQPSTIAAPEGAPQGLQPAESAASARRAELAPRAAPAPAPKSNQPVVAEAAAATAAAVRSAVPKVAAVPAKAVPKDGQPAAAGVVVASPLAKAALGAVPKHGQQVSDDRRESFGTAAADVPYSALDLRVLVADAVAHEPASAQPLRNDPNVVALRFKDRQRPLRGATPPFSRWAVDESLRFGSDDGSQPSWAEALGHPSAENRLATYQRNGVLSFFSRLWCAWALQQRQRERGRQDVRQQPQQQQQQQRQACVICLVADRSCLLQPCNHLALCSDCAQAAQANAVADGRSWHCPVCRVQVGNAVRIFVP
jgi:hypothetical protein